MEAIIIIIISVISILIIGTLMKTNKKEMEKIATDEELNKKASLYPKNIEICRTILKQVKNENVKIEENENSNSTYYIAIQNKILIGNTHNSFTRIQTVIHECLHTIQDRKLLIFNYIFSNIYLLYFLVISILLIIHKLPNELLFSNILLIMGLIYYVVRIFLENDAMIKAEFITKEYIDEQKTGTEKDRKELKEGFEKLNKGAIRGTNCIMFINIMIKVVFFNVLALIF